MGDLVVELYGTVVGHVSGDQRSFDFIASEEAVRRFGLDSFVLSVAVPLGLVRTKSRRALRQAFFRNLLPEGEALTRLAERAGVDVHDVVGFLRSYGRDVAGALQIWDPDLPGEPRMPRLEPVDDSTIACLLTDVQSQPLGNRLVGGKTSLAGVQDKIVLAWVDGWHQALDGYASTHILKPEVAHQPTLIYDEEYGARIMRALGLATFSTSVCTFDEVSALVVERFDRTARGGRLHAEDFAQALGVTGIQKYQKYGGTTTLARVAAVLRQHDPDSLASLARMVVVAVAVGNLDLHAKNLGLLHSDDGTVSLAPAYDWVPLAHQPTDGELAMAVGREYRHNLVTSEHLVREFAGWRLSNASQLIQKTLEEIVNVVQVEVPLDGAHIGLQEDILAFARRLLRGEPVGRPQSL